MMKTEISLKKATKSRCNNQERVLTHYVTKRTWIFDEVFHDNPEINAILNEVFVGLTMDFTKDTYHIIIPNTGRDDIGTWEFVDDFQKMLVDEGMETEHFIGVENLTMREFMFSFDDPEVGPWTMRLVPMFARWHKPAKDKD